jgi:uncharacterized protein (TIGR03067 family)
MEDPVKKSLPARPNLDHLRSQAKQLLAKLREGDAAAARTFIDHLPSANTMSPDDVRRAEFRLADAQSAIARQSGFAAWPGLARHVEQLRAWEGDWRFVSLEVDGQAVPPAMMGEARLLVDGDRFRMESPEGAYEGVFTLDVEVDPPQIDIEFVEGPEAGEHAYGIFRLEDDRLELCLGVVGATRPAGFVTSPGSGHALERLRRSSAARPEGVDGGTRRTPAASTPAAALKPVDESVFALHMTPLLASLQGDWTPVALVTGGSALQKAMLPFGSRSIAGNETKVVFGGQVMVHAKMRIDDTYTPIAVDYLNIGRGPKAVTHGIMALEGDLLRVCMAPAGAPRPTSFTSDKTNGCTLSEWQRRAPTSR